VLERELPETGQRRGAKEVFIIEPTPFMMFFDRGLTPLGRRGEVVSFSSRFFLFVELAIIQRGNHVAGERGGEEAEDDDQENLQTRNIVLQYDP
jgi:hypothetical protein